MSRNRMEPTRSASESVYISSKVHQAIGIESRKGHVSLDNIGKNGRNLTIAVLSMNRSNLTIRLFESIIKHIPDFEGKLLIGDNGSEQKEIELLRDAFKNAPFECRIIEFGQNYGVAGGRNRLYKEVDTDWLMSLDNDLYFTSNLLEQAQEDIATFGSHFLALPMIDKGTNSTGIYGWHLHMERKSGRPLITIKPAYDYNKKAQRNVAMEGFLCTGLPGGAAILNKETFFTAGAFDDNMFVGFEDIEFSVRLFQKGYKVATCGMLALEHDHPKAEKAHDISYEQGRFSSNKLFEAAMYFEKKHGLQVWDDETSKWVQTRQREAAGKSCDDAQKIKVALLIDSPHWAFDRIADQIVKHLSDEFTFYRFYTLDIDNIADILLLAKDCQIIHALWRYPLAFFRKKQCQKRIYDLGYTEKKFYNKFVKGKIISTAVYDHLFLDQDSDITEQLFCKKDSICDSYVTSSKKLYDIYSSLPGVLIKPTAVLSDGVDTSMFTPKSSTPFDKPKEKLILGWAGNSHWSYGDLKGINTIIRPAIEELQKEGYPVELKTTDRDEGGIPHHEMPEFYSSLDCYVCASLSEGTPNPVLESMACGIPVISTNVGIVPEVFGPEQQKFILEERNVECLKEKIKILLENRPLLKTLSEENLNSIRSWDWSLKMEEVRKYFRNLLKYSKKSS